MKFHYAKVTEILLQTSLLDPIDSYVILTCCLLTVCAMALHRLLNGNKLSGSLPDELGYLSNLKRLQVDMNQISGPVPSSFSNLKSVRHMWVDLWAESYFKLTMAYVLFFLVYLCVCNFCSHLNNNSISGQIPSDLSNLSNLIHL